MCFSKKTTATTPAAAPAPALEPADAPEVGQTRKQESEELYGSDTPNYRVTRPSTQTTVNPNGNITM